jgi:hypothetical protein
MNEMEKCVRDERWSNTWELYFDPDKQCWYVFADRQMEHEPLQVVSGPLPTALEAAIAALSQPALDECANCSCQYPKRDAFCPNCGCDIVEMRPQPERPAHES